VEKLRIRILVVEDFELARRFISTALAKDPSFEVVGEVSDGLTAAERAEDLQPDVILLDIGLPGLNGIEAAKRIRKTAPRAKIVFVSQQSSPELVQAALAVGGSGYVLKSDAGNDLLKAISAVLNGETFLSRALRGKISLMMFF
jgi:DNA-binding NarL/FixJ family response regulator